jgi:acyl-CoA hydrolase
VAVPPTTTTTLEDAVAHITASDSIAVPLGPGQPGSFLHGLAARDDYDGLTVSGALLVDFYEVLSKPGVRHLSGFYGPIERILIDQGADVEFIPSDFRRFAPLLERLCPRVMATVATPPDADGNLSLSLHAGATVAELHRAGADPDRLLVVEMNPNFPRTRGLPPEHAHAVHLDEIDVLIESDRPPFLLEDPPATEVEVAIAGFARSFVTDGCTLQTGIGGVPSTVVGLLASEDGGDYGVHSEMFTTGLMHLHRSGKVTNQKGGPWDGFSVTTFSAGTQELYDWLDENDEVRFLPVDLVNSRHRIAENRKMVTINGAICIDLYGQVVADTIGPRQYSGIGGHEDFVSATGFELEDRSLVCLPSTATAGGSVVSRIVGSLPAGWVITTPRHQLDVVVTEFGSAELRGGTVRERALALAEIAHPDFREELRSHAEQMS